MKRPNDYSQQSRFYTGLYSTKAYNVIKKAVRTYYSSTIDAVRAFDNEVVVVNTFESAKPDIKGIMITALRYAGNTAKDKNAFILRKFFEGKKLDVPSSKKLQLLRGKRIDDVAAEVAGCEEDEERRVKAEHDAFIEKLLRRHFISPNHIIGRYGCAPYQMDKRTLFSGPVDRAELEKYFTLETEMLELNNQLAKTFKAYSDKFKEFSEARKALRRLNSETKARRVKDVKTEFRLAKRGPRA